MYSGLDPLTEDLEALAIREEEEAREQRWAEFVDHVRVYAIGMRWSTVVNAAADAMDNETGEDFLDTCRSFAETEGFDGVLSAIARAIKECTEDANEVERRR